MKPARLAVLAIALAAGGGAVLLMGGEGTPPAPVTVVQAAVPAPMAEVLVAAVDLPMGQTLQAADLRWQTWPEAAVVSGYITRAASPNAVEETVGSIARTNFLASEPLRPEKLAKGGRGFMSAILPAGMRAVAIVTETSGSNSAGGFILPNDHVDIIKTYHDQGSDGQVSETLLQDVRVLAVGQVVQEKNGANVVTGSTATLALTPAQAELITHAQKVGQLSLALRSLVDSGQGDTRTDVAPEAGLTVVRFGIAKQQPRR